MIIAQNVTVDYASKKRISTVHLTLQASNSNEEVIT